MRERSDCCGLEDIRTRRALGARDDSGAVLILALVFLVVVGMIVLALAGWVGNDLTNTITFENARSTDYAANSATQVAIQSMRHNPLLGNDTSNQTLNASPPSYCWGSGPTSAISVDSVNVAVWCSTVWNPLQSDTRVVTFSACPTATGYSSGFSAAQCAAQPLLQTVVTFDDYPPGIASPNPGVCTLYCGTSMTENSADWSPVVPSVTSISPSSGSIVGGSTPVTITGTGFLAGSTVNFVDSNPTDNNVYTVTPSPTNISPTSITVNWPAVTDATSYYVTVTTPDGTSATSSAAEFTYAPVTPTVTGISTNSGATSGGTSVTITGTGFINDASVSFVDTANSSVVASAASSSLTVDNPTTITVVTPPVTAGGTYYVTVTTVPGGTSADNANAEFDYVPIYPVVGGISPSSGGIAGGTSVTITGIGFVSGATVNFVEETGGTDVVPTVSLAATSVDVTSSDTITAVTPAVTTGASTYYVTVTTSVATSANYAIYTYTSS